LKNKNLKLEFRDPFRQNNTGFKATTRRPRGGNSISNSTSVNFEPVNTEVPEIASDQDVVAFMDFEPGNIDCMQDFLNNWKTYLALSSFLAYSFKSVLPSFIKLGSQTIKMGVKTLTSLSIKPMLAAMADFVKNVPKNLKISAKGGFGAGGAVDDLAKIWNNANWGSSSNWSKAKSGFKLSARTGMIGVNALKNVLVFAAVVAGIYYFAGGKALLAWAQKNSDEGGVLNNLWYSIDVAVRFFVETEGALEFVLLQMNQDLDKECKLSNVIAGAFLVTILTGRLPSGAKGMPTQEELAKMNPDQIKKLLLEQKAARISDFSADISENLGTRAQKLGVEPKVLTNYINDMLTGKQKQALQSLLESGVDPKKASKFHNKAAEYVDLRRVEFLKKLESERKANVAAIRQYGDNNISEPRAAFAEWSKRALEVTRKMNLDPQNAARIEVGASRAALSADEMSELSRLVVNLPGQEKIFKITTIEELAASTKIVEDLLRGGQIGLGESVKLYRRVFMPQIEKLATNLLNSTSHGGTLTNSATAVQKIEALNKTLLEFGKNEKLIADMLKNLSPGQEAMPSVLNKILKRNKPSKTGQAKNLNEAKWALDLAKREIIKLNFKIKPENLVVLDKTIDATYKAVKKVSGVDSTSKMGALGQNIMMGGIFVGVVSVFAKKILAEDTDDLETWQRADLARHLAWEGWLGPMKVVGSEFTSASRSDSYRINLNKLVNRMDSDNGISALNSIYKNYIFKENGPFVKMVVSKSKEDFSSRDVVNEFRIKKKKNTKIRDALVRGFGADLRGFGLSGLGSTSSAKEFHAIWHPILISIMIANSGLVGRFETEVRKNEKFWSLNETARKEFINTKVLKYDRDEIEDSLEQWIKLYKREWKSQKNTGDKQMKENKELDINKLSLLVKEVISESRGQGYNTYPYHSYSGEDEEPAEDFIEDWKAFELSLMRDESRNTAIEVAKILVKDLELFGDVIDLVGKNQSVATEILKALREKETKKA